MCDKWTTKFALKVTYTSSTGALVGHSICVSYKGTEVWERLLRDRMDYESNKNIGSSSFRAAFKNWRYVETI